MRVACHIVWKQIEASIIIVFEDFQQVKAVVCLPLFNGDTEEANQKAMVNSVRTSSNSFIQTEYYLENQKRHCEDKTNPTTFS